jgi:biopolymer transport protein ExbB/TolQ
MGNIIDFITSGGIISVIVFVWLSIYFIVTIWIFFSKSVTITALENVEKESLNGLLKGETSIKKESVLSRCIKGSNTPELLSVCKSFAEENATKGLSILAIISSTSPFIGLFGTIVSILKTFSKLGEAGSASLNVIAPAISEALVATAVGIFVAIPAYSLHLILKRKAYEYISLVQREIDILKLKTYTDY